MNSEYLPHQVAADEVCELCGLRPTAGTVAAEIYGEHHIFCCAGCRMVFTMLVEAGGGDPAAFKESDLYRQCVAAGVVPASQADVAAMAVLEEPETPTTDSGATAPATLVYQCRVKGMWCPACAWVIQSALSKVPGVVLVDCDFSIDRLQYRYDPAVTAPHLLSEVLGRLGYTALDDEDATIAAQQRRELVRLIVSVVLSMNTMMLSYALYSGFFTDLPPSAIRFISWPIIIFATAVLIYGGGPVARKAWSGLLARSPGMEVLILLGAGSAYGLSLLHFIQGSIHLYFDTAAMLITLLLLGKWLENRAKEKVRRDLDGFMTLQPKKIRLCSAQYPHGRYVAADQVATGDLVRVLPAEIVPVDGTVVQGRARMDLSTITGEPEPVPKGPGDDIVSGSRLVSGRLDIRADQVGEQSLLGQMIAVVQAGLSHKAEVENRSRLMLAIFIPIIIAAAALTALVLFIMGAPAEQALVRAITVMVAACPCALGIAVPLARVAGISGAGRQGLLVRDSTVFDRSHHIDTIVFDKTGTMTEGRWTLVRVAPAADVEIESVLGLALALENGAEHPAAGAIAAYASRFSVKPALVTNIHPVEGGIAGLYDHRTVAIGSPVMLSGQYKNGRERIIGRPVEAGPSSSQVVLIIEGAEVAQFYFRDPIRSSAGDLVSRLAQMGYTLHLISGDTPAAVKETAALLNIIRYKGGLLPQGKAEYIKALQSHGAGVAMVGDGINDAAALSQAQLAVAVHSGAPLARQVGAVTLMRSDPSQLLDLLGWLRRVNRKIRQNLGWAWVYNLIAVPMAMAGWLTPLIAVTAMLLSSLTLIVNTSLLLGRRHNIEPIAINQVGEKSQV